MDSYQTDFINCVLRTLQPVCTSASLSIHVGEGLEVDRILGNYLSSSVRTGAHCSVVRIELGRSTPSTAISMLVSSSKSSFKGGQIPVSTNRLDCSNHLIHNEDHLAFSQLEYLFYYFALLIGNFIFSLYSCVDSTRNKLLGQSNRHQANSIPNLPIAHHP